jgi:hypothetical protein
MALVNHNIIKKTSWIKIVHTLMGNICQESDDKDDMNALENMGNDACVIVGYHEKASEFTTNVRHFPNWNNPNEMWTTNTEYNFTTFQDMVEDPVTMIRLNPVREGEESVKRRLFPKLKDLHAFVRNNISKKY